MNWFSRKFRNAPNEELSQSTGELGSLGIHLGDWCDGELAYDLATLSDPFKEARDHNPAATLVTSLIEPADGVLEALHAPVLDLDLEHVYYESSTPGHAALLLNVELTWTEYVELLAVLLKCGIIEQGYHDASIQRGYSACRTPWTKKPGSA